MKLPESDGFSFSAVTWHRSTYQIYGSRPHAEPRPVLYPRWESPMSVCESVGCRLYHCRIAAPHLRHQTFQLIQTAQLQRRSTKKFDDAVEHQILLPLQSI